MTICTEDRRLAADRHPRTAPRCSQPHPHPKLNRRWRRSNPLSKPLLICAVTPAVPATTASPWATRTPQPTSMLVRIEVTLISSAPLPIPRCQTRRAALWLSLFPLGSSTAQLSPTTRPAPLGPGPLGLLVLRLWISQLDPHPRGAVMPAARCIPPSQAASPLCLHKCCPFHPICSPRATDYPGSMAAPWWPWPSESLVLCPRPSQCHTEATQCCPTRAVSRQLSACPHSRDTPTWCSPGHGWLLDCKRSVCLCWEKEGCMARGA